MSSTQHANVTNTGTSKAQRAKETCAIPLAFTEVVLRGRSLFLVLIIELPLFLSARIAGTDAGKCWEQVDLALVAARAGFRF